MAPQFRPRDILLYFKRLKRSRQPFLCPHCDLFVLPREFESHCTQEHHINAKLACVWCSGRTTWSSRQKNLHGQHLLDCFQQFQFSYHPTTIKEPMCAPRQFFDHERLQLPRAYDPIWPCPLSPLSVFFRHDTLNLAASCTRLYLELKDSVDFFHVMVRAAAYESFLEAMDNDQGQSRTLPFSCWCDGGQHPHRHMIVVSSPKGHFQKNVWRKIKIPRRPHKHFTIIDKRRFRNTLHFVNTLGYLSRRQSMSSQHDNHFYIQTPLPEYYKIACAVQWKGGILELVHQEYRNTSPEDFIEAPSLTNSRGKWQMLVKDIPGIPLDIKLPLHFQLSPTPTDYFIHANKIVYFKPPSYAKTRPAKLHFYAVVGEEIWYPSPFQQKCLNASKKLIDRCGSLKEKLREREQELATLKAKLSHKSGHITNLTPPHKSHSPNHHRSGGKKLVTNPYA